MQQDTLSPCGNTTVIKQKITSMKDTDSVYICCLTRLVIPTLVNNYIQLCTVFTNKKKWSLFERICLKHIYKKFRNTYIPAGYTVLRITFLLTSQGKMHQPFTTAGQLCITKSIQNKSLWVGELQDNVGELECFWDDLPILHLCFGIFIQSVRIVWHYAAGTVCVSSSHAEKTECWTKIPWIKSDCYYWSQLNLWILKVHVYDSGNLKTF